MLAKAECSLRSARLLAADGSYDFAASRAYYAAFYAIEAALLVHNVEATTHTGIIGECSKIFFKTDILPKELSKTLGNLFRERQTADYDYFDIITAEQAEEDYAGGARSPFTAKSAPLLADSAAFHVR